MGIKLRLASMVKNSITDYIDPNNADIWLMEEPTYRGAGQVIRSLETKRSDFDSTIDQYSTTLSFQPDRVSEFLRFRKPLRDAGKIIIRSRSEESACYQIMDSRFIRDGVSMSDYISYPGNKIAFQNPPTHIFIVCGPENWDKNEYIKLKTERTGKRVLDDFENRVDYQLLINNRYASDWLENLYAFAANYYKTSVPQIFRFNIYDSMSTTRNKMVKKLNTIFEEASLLKNK